jgi:protein-L-isoaspartate(D-aspartate) O-methyltransferase
LLSSIEYPILIVGIHEFLWGGFEMGPYLKSRFWHDFLVGRCRWSGVFLFILVVASILPACTTSSTPQPSQPTSTSATAAAQESDAYVQDRLDMVADTIQSRGITTPAVLEAMRNVPRHLFVPEDFIHQAYADHPLPIGYGQTISQPFIVAWMTDLLELQPGDKVLEIGTGSGYQAAVLAELGGLEVYTIEIVPELAKNAAERLAALGYDQVMCKADDGYYGWPEYAPFDAIIVTAAPDHLPAPLATQIKEGGRLVIPIGPPGGYQSLWKFVKQDGTWRAYNMGGVSFVPFTGEGISGSSP